MAVKGAAIEAGARANAKHFVPDDELSRLRAENESLRRAYVRPDDLREQLETAKKESAMLRKDRDALAKVADRLLTDLENVVEGLDTEEAAQVAEMRNIVVRSTCG